MWALLLWAKINFGCAATHARARAHTPPPLTKHKTKPPKPKTTNPKSLSQIDNWFDSISYDKGAAVLRMLRAFLAANASASAGGATDAAAPLVLVLAAAAAAAEGVERDLWMRA